MAYCKRGRGAIRVNGRPLEMLEPQALKFKVRHTICFTFFYCLSVIGLFFFLALGTHSTPRQGAILRRWHPCEGKRRRKRRTDLRYDAQYCGPFLSTFFTFAFLLYSYPASHFQGSRRVLSEMYVKIYFWIAWPRGWNLSCIGSIVWLIG